MADKVDIAAEIFEARHQEQIREIQRQSYQTLASTGKCHNCGDITGSGQVFCDAECAEEWEWVAQRKKLNAS